MGFQGTSEKSKQATEQSLHLPPRVKTSLLDSAPCSHSEQRKALRSNERSLKWKQKAQQHIPSGLNVQLWMHLPLKKKFPPRVLFNSCCPSRVWGVYRKNNVELLQQHWFDMCPYITAPRCPWSFQRGSPGVQDAIETYPCLCLFHPKRGPKQAMEQKSFPRTILQHSEAEVWMCYKCAWIHISRFSNESFT